MGGVAVRLLDDLEKGLIVTDNPDTLADQVVSDWHDLKIPGELMDALGLTQEEYTAWASFGATFGLLLEWRLHGRPSTCELCGKPIGEEHWAVFRRDNGEQIRSHFACWAKAAGQRKLDSKLVARFLKRNGLATEYSPYRHESGLITPEYRVLKDGAQVGVCEVKTAPAFGRSGGAGTGTAFTDLDANLRTAVAQFSLVNPDTRLVNILAFVDHKSGLRWEDLRALVIEDMAAETRARYESERHEGEGELDAPPFGQVKAGKWPVDVYLWFSSKRGPAAGPGRFGTRFSVKMIFSSNDPGRFLRACALFGVDAAAVPTLS